MCDEKEREREREREREGMGLILILLLLLPLFVVAPEISCSLLLTDTVVFTVAVGYSINMSAANT